MDTYDKKWMHMKKEWIYMKRNGSSKMDVYISLINLVISMNNLYKRRKLLLLTLLNAKESMTNLSMILKWKILRLSHLFYLCSAMISKLGQPGACLTTGCSDITFGSLY